MQDGVLDGNATQSAFEINVEAVLKAATCLWACKSDWVVLEGSGFDLGQINVPQRES